MLERIARAVEESGPIATASPRAPRIGARICRRQAVLSSIATLQRVRSGRSKIRGYHFRWDGSHWVDTRESGEFAGSTV